jgi:hypothetical protein
VIGDFCTRESEGEFTGAAGNDSANKGVRSGRKEIKEEISKWQRKAEAVE